MIKVIEDTADKLIMEINIDALAQQITFCKFDDQPWGFRITGGADFGTPVTIIKVYGGSIAEMAGLQVGDILVQINEQSMASFTHQEAYEALVNAGNSFMLGVVRGSLVSPPRRTPGEAAFIEIEEENIQPQPTSTPELVTVTEENLEQETTEQQETNVLTSRPESVLDAIIAAVLSQGMVSQAATEFESFNEVHFSHDTEKQFEDLSSVIMEQTLEENMLNEPTLEVLEGELQHQQEIDLKERVAGPENENLMEPKDELEQEEQQSQEQALNLSENEIKGAEGAMQNFISCGKEKELGVSDAIKNQNQNQKTSGVEKKELTDQDIAEMMLEHAELIAGKAFGVDFIKLQGKSEIIEQSRVLKVLQEEEENQNVQHKKQVTTFLLAPNRPKVKPKEIPKKIQIPEVHSPSIRDESNKDRVNACKEAQENEATITVEPKDSSEEHLKKAEQLGEKITLDENDTTIDTVEASHNEASEVVEIQSEDSVEKSTTKESYQHIEEKYEESATNKKLRDIQNQLATLFQLPKEMEQQLFCIKEQIISLVTNKDQTEEATEVKEGEPTEEGGKNQVTEDKEGEEKQTEILPPDNEEEAPKENILEAEGVEEVKDFEGENAISEENHTADDQFVGKQLDIEGGTKATTDKKGEDENVVEDAQVEKQKQDIQWQREKPKKNRPFFPLTPHPRPIQLPGGIKWSCPTERYDDEFIAETLSGNAEIITGTTLGVNFHKYKRNYDHLKTSSVYRMIHEEESKCPGSFQGRSTKLFSTEDYKVEEDRPGEVA